MIGLGLTGSDHPSMFCSIMASDSPRVLTQVFKWRKEVSHPFADGPPSCVVVRSDPPRPPPPPCPLPVESGKGSTHGPSRWSSKDLSAGEEEPAHTPRWSWRDQVSAGSLYLRCDGLRSFFFATSGSRNCCPVRFPALSWIETTRIVQKLSLHRECCYLRLVVSKISSVNVVL